MICIHLKWLVPKVGFESILMLHTNYKVYVLFILRQYFGALFNHLFSRRHGFSDTCMWHFHMYIIKDAEGMKYGAVIS